MRRSIPEREITAHEAAIIEWLLDHAAMRDVSAYRGVVQQPLDNGSLVRRDLALGDAASHFF